MILKLNLRKIRVSSGTFDVATPLQFNIFMFGFSANDADRIGSMKKVEIGPDKAKSFLRKRRTTGGTTIEEWLE